MSELTEIRHVLANRQLFTRHDRVLAALAMADRITHLGEAFAQVPENVDV
jgi:hypothetical protein